MGTRTEGDPTWTFDLHAARTLLEPQALAGELIASGAYPDVPGQLESLEFRVDLDSPRAEVHPLLVTLLGGRITRAGPRGGQENAERQRGW